MKQQLILFIVAFLSVTSAFAQGTRKNVVDEVIWVVGDEPILLSDVEEARISMEMNGEAIANPYAVIPERIAIDKLYIHQAELDSVEVNEANLTKMADERINFVVQQYGSRENMEAMLHKSTSQLREMFIEMGRTQQMKEEVEHSLTSNVRVTPAEVRDYFSKLPQDSLPYVPTKVEVQIITSVPKVSPEEIDRIESQLREYARQVNEGEKTFAHLARMYSEDRGSALNGGECGLSGRNQWVPEFANVAFSLTDPKKVSRIVRTEFGFHIMQLIEKRSDKVNVRHILLKPEIEEEEYTRCLNRLDSICADIREGKFTFEQAAQALSDDKDTKLNKGIMVNSNFETGEITSRFEMNELPQDIAKVVANMAVGDISPAVRIINEKTGSEICAVIKLKSRTEGHRANVSEDFQVLKRIVEAERKGVIIEKWLKEKIKNTYTRISPEWRNYSFRYDGWVK